MVKSEALFIPEDRFLEAHHPARIVPNRISAIQLTPTNGGGARLGMITQLPQTAQLEVCGDGFNDRTIKVRWRDSFYFVFRADVEITNIAN